MVAMHEAALLLLHLPETGLSLFEGSHELGERNLLAAFGPHPGVIDFNFLAHPVPG